MTLPPRAVAISAAVTVAALYQWALMLVCRTGVVAEVVICVVFPAACALTGRLRHLDARVAQLVFIETYFCVAAIASKLTVSASAAVRATVGALFVGFFVMQCAGFIVAQRRRRSPHGVFQTLALVTLIAHWWWRRPDASAVVDASGRLLVFGVEAPLTVRLAYVLWVSNVLFVQTRTLPRLHQALVHVVSVALAFGSGEFFHGRLLTACHLFVLDLLFNYSEGLPDERTSLALSPTMMRAHERYGRRALSWSASVAIALVAAAQLAR